MTRNYKTLCALRNACTLSELSLKEAKILMEKEGGQLDLRHTQITELPEGLSVGGNLILCGTQLTELPEGLTVGGNLNLRYSKITELPEGLTVGGFLNLSYSKITELPEGLSVGGSLNLEDTPITELPEGFSVDGNLNLEDTLITELPEGLTVGGGLYLHHTQITELPEGLSVGGDLDLRGTQIKELPAGLVVGKYLHLTGSKVVSLSEDIRIGWGIATCRKKILEQWDNGRTRFLLSQGEILERNGKKFIYADQILTQFENVHSVENFKVFKGALGTHVVTDGEYYAHCKDIRTGISDIAFKKAKNRGADQYKGLATDTQMSVEEAKTMYRIITGACYAGTEAFVKSLGELKEKYSIKEMLELTKNQYGHEAFAKFFA